MQVTAVCAIAWQQALPEAMVRSQVETDSALKHLAEICLVGVHSFLREEFHIPKKRQWNAFS